MVYNYAQDIQNSDSTPERLFTVIVIVYVECRSGKYLKLLSFQYTKVVLRFGVKIYYKNTNASNILMYIEPKNATESLMLIKINYK